MKKSKPAKYKMLRGTKEKCAFCKTKSILKNVIENVQVKTKIVCENCGAEYENGFWFKKKNHFY